MIPRPFHLIAAAKWLAVLIPMAVAVGSASAFFLWSLDALTRTRFDNPWLLWLLPLGGFGIGWLYHHQCSKCRIFSFTPGIQGSERRCEWQPFFQC